MQTSVSGKKRNWRDCPKSICRGFFTRLDLLCCPTGQPSESSLQDPSQGVLHLLDWMKQACWPNSRLHHLPWRCWRTRTVLPPSFGENPQIQCRTEQGPLCSHGFQSPDRPASKAVVLF